MQNDRPVCPNGHCRRPCGSDCSCTVANDPADTGGNPIGPAGSERGDGRCNLHQKEMPT